MSTEVRACRAHELARSATMRASGFKDAVGILALPELLEAIARLDAAELELQAARRLVTTAAAACSKPKLDADRIEAAITFLRGTEGPVEWVLENWPYADLRQRLVDELRAAGYIVGQ